MIGTVVPKEELKRSHSSMSTCLSQACLCIDQSALTISTITRLLHQLEVFASIRIILFVQYGVSQDKHGCL
jgi:hypothetical protein